MQRVMLNGAIILRAREQQEKEGRGEEKMYPLSCVWNASRTFIAHAFRR
jgi:hypothetical protein